MKEKKIVCPCTGKMCEAVCGACRFFGTLNTSSGWEGTAECLYHHYYVHVDDKACDDFE